MLHLATKVAESSDERNKHGAVIVKGGRVLAVGVNKYRNSPAVVESDNKVGRGTVFSKHAEISALSRVKDAHGATIYVARVKKNGSTSLSAPCNNCRKALIAAGISTVIYTT